MTWNIDDEGRIFHDGKWIGTIKRQPHNDGTHSIAYHLGVNRVIHDTKPIDTVLDVAVYNHTAWPDLAEWEAVNATQEGSA